MSATPTKAEEALKELTNSRRLRNRRYYNRHRDRLLRDKREKYRLARRKEKESGNTQGQLD